MQPPGPDLMQPPGPDLIQKLTQAIASDWGQNPGATDDIYKAAASRYHMAGLVCGCWNVGIDDWFPESNTHAVLMEIHGVPPFERSWQQGRNDFWPQMRWLVDVMLEDWQADPGEIATINQSRFRQSLHDIEGAHGGAAWPVPMLSQEEIERLHKLKLSLRHPENRDTVRMEIATMCEQRHDALRESLERYIDTDKKIYLLHYFGFTSPDRSIVSAAPLRPASGKLKR